MIAEIKKATFAEAATRNIEQTESYQTPRHQSRLKNEIGEILLSLFAGNAQPGTWRLFDQLLRQLYAGGI